MYDACAVEYSWVWGEGDARTDTERKKGREKNESVWGAYERTCKGKCNDHSRAPSGSIALVEICVCVCVCLSLSLSPKRIEGTPSRSLSQKDHLHSISLSLSQKDRKHSLQIPLSKGSFALHFSLFLSDQCTLEISVSLSLKMINCTPDLSLSLSLSLSLWYLPLS